jgi:hypothetical protein
MDNEYLTKIFKSAYSKYYKSGMRRITAEFYPYRSLRHTIEWTMFHIRIKVSRYFINAPVTVLEILAIILLAKVYRIKVDPEMKKRYNVYALQLRRQLAPVKKRSLFHYNAQGSYFNLEETFHEINSIYFNSQVIVKHLGWSKHNSYRRLGFYDHNRGLLVISKIFDSEKVPPEVIKYLLYHEMLHVVIPVEETKLRRQIHTAKFRKMERQFPNFQKINLWIKKNLHKL